MFFINQLDHDQKRSFLALATRMLLADGEVDRREERLLTALGREIGLSTTVPKEEIYGPINVAAFTDRRSKVVVTIAFLVMGLVDGHFHANESVVFKDLVSRFGFSDAEVARMRDIAEREKSVINDLEALAG